MRTRRFTLDEVEAIRFAYDPNNPERDYKGLANIWGCTPLTIEKIVTYQTYKEGYEEKRRASWESFSKRSAVNYTKAQVRERLSKTVPKPRPVPPLFTVTEPQEFSGKNLPPLPFLTERTDEEIGW